jgi:NADPH:quinone reductase
LRIYYSKGKLMTNLPTEYTLMLSQISEGGELKVFFEKRPMPEPQDHEVLIKVLATPINPSDLGLLFGAANMSTSRASEANGMPALIANVPDKAMRAMQGRMGQALPIGNEGCGLVVAAGASEAAQALMGKTVALAGGELYGEYRCVPAMACMALPDGIDPKEGASCFVNPLTALAFTEVMRRDGHKAIVHTAAASNLGQMLVRICAQDNIPLVNIVRSEAQEALLRGMGASHVLNSNAPDFMAMLVTAIKETGATIGFDAIGGGSLAGQILNAMEQAAVETMSSYSRYGSDTFKHVYIYGALDMGPTQFPRNFGFQWSLSGFLLTPFMASAGMETITKMRQRVGAELTTTFKSHYSHEIGLFDTVNPDIAAAYNAKRTGEKYLIRLK